MERRPISPHYLSNYVFESEIGRGSFASVYKGYEKTSLLPVAIKSVRLDRLNKKLAENLATEIAILKDIQHPNIVRLYEIQKTDDYIYLVMEFCNGGDLAQYLRRNKGLNEAEVKHCVRQLASAIEVLRMSNLFHRDLKPQNLLLSVKNPTETGSILDAELKIADFGFARYITPTDLAETLCGSPLYMAPEILSYEKYDSKADLWSIGAIMFQMIYGKAPFRAPNHIQLQKLISRAPSVPLPREGLYGRISESCQSLMRGLLQKNPVERISFEEFFTHPFLGLVSLGAVTAEGTSALPVGSMQSRSLSHPTCWQSPVRSAAVPVAVTVPNTRRYTAPELQQSEPPFSRPHPVISNNKPGSSDQATPTLVAVNSYGSSYQSSAMLPPPFARIGSSLKTATMTTTTLSATRHPTDFPSTRQESGGVSGLKYRRSNELVTAADQDGSLVFSAGKNRSKFEAIDESVALQDELSMSAMFGNNRMKWSSFGGSSGQEEAAVMRELERMCRLTSALLQAYYWEIKSDQQQQVVPVRSASSSSVHGRGDDEGGGEDEGKSVLSVILVILGRIVDVCKSEEEEGNDKSSMMGARLSRVAEWTAEKYTEVMGLIGSPDCTANTMSSSMTENATSNLHSRMTVAMTASENKRTACDDGTSGLQMSMAIKLYEVAMKSARDGGIEELLGHCRASSMLYRRARFLLEVLESPELYRPHSNLLGVTGCWADEDRIMLQSLLQAIDYREQCVRSKLR